MRAFSWLPEEGRFTSKRALLKDIHVMRLHFIRLEHTWDTLSPFLPSVTLPELVHPCLSLAVQTRFHNTTSAWLEVVGYCTLRRAVLTTFRELVALCRGRYIYAHSGAHTLCVSGSVE